MDTPLALLVLFLVDSASLRPVTLTCADTAQGNLKPLANCTLKAEIIVCAEFYSNAHSMASNGTAFRILEQVNDIQFCIGLINSSKSNEGFRQVNHLEHTVGFNSSLAVGVVTVDRKCWDTQRSSHCLLLVTMLQQVLELGVMKCISDTEEFWNFDSMLYGTTMDWFHVLNVDARRRFIYSEWLTNLQNTSIRDLNVRTTTCVKGGNAFLLKDMPYLLKLDLTYVCIEKFHKDTFTGTQNLEYILFSGDDIKSIPIIVSRLPKLKKVSIFERKNRFISFNYKSLFQSSLQYLELQRIYIGTELNGFPLLPGIRTVILYDCAITTLEWNAFRNIYQVETLDLAYNYISSIHKEAFLSLRNLKYLYLSRNNLAIWPVLYYSSLLILDLSHNRLEGFTNPSVFDTTIEHLNVMGNFISDWDDLEVFSYKGNVTKTRNFYSNVGEDKKLYVTNNISSYKSISEDNSSSMKKWVRTLDISSNQITRLTNIMLKSMDGLQQVTLTGNPFNCSDCTMPGLQTWIKTTKINIKDILTVRCYSAYRERRKPIIDIEFDLETCIVKGHNYWILAGIPLGIGGSLFMVIISIYIRFRSQIVYMLHLYRIRKQKSGSRNECNFDAFVCYSSQDRRFVLTVLAPLLENCPERYRLCLHERDFAMGSHIVDNIVGAIESSCRIILILSPHFLDSKFCNWELKMANIKMFDVGQQFLILIQVAPMDRDKIPRHLKHYMDTRTFLSWTQEASAKSVKEMGRQLKKSLGNSIFQSSSQQPHTAGSARLV